MIYDSVKDNINELTQIDEKKGKEFSDAYDALGKRARKELEKAENAAKKDPIYLMNQKFKQTLEQVKKDIYACIESREGEIAKIKERNAHMLNLLQDLGVIEACVENIIKKARAGGLENEQ